MKTVSPCYAVVVPSDYPDGSGRPILMESYLDIPKREVIARAASLQKTYKEAWVIELPIMISKEIIGVAGSANKVVWRSGDEDELA